MRWRVAVLVSLIMSQMGGWLLVASPALAGVSGIYISELQTSGATGFANNEFVELYNSTAAKVSLSGWHLDYRSSMATGDCTQGWTKKVTLPTAAAIQAQGFYLLAPKAYLTNADAGFTASIASSAGSIRVVDGTGTTVDALAWGTGSLCGNGDAATPPSPEGGSLERLPGAQLPHAGNAYNTNNNANDFVVRTLPEPQPSTSVPEVPADYSGGQLQLSEIAPVPAVGAGTDSEFVELQNVGTTVLELQQYQLQVGDGRYGLPEQIMLPGAYVVLGATASSLPLNGSGGIATLLDRAGNQLDTTSWSNAPAATSWARIGSLWTWTSQPTSGANNIYTPIADVAAGQGGTQANTTGGDTPATNYPAIVINELLPDPAPPATDATDEFIELYNPNPFTVDLHGYVLESGPTLASHFTLPNVSVAAGSYVAFTSAQTTLTLANDGGQVAIVDPAGQPIGDIMRYDRAPTGQAWAQFDGGWAWTTTPTPAAANILTVPAVLSANTTASTGVAKPAKKTTTKLTQPKTKPVAAKKTSTKKLKVSTAKVPEPVAAATTMGGAWLLYVLVGLTIAYIVYEFRYDVRNYYYRLRRHPAGGSTPRQTS